MGIFDTFLLTYYQRRGQRLLANGQLEKANYLFQKALLISDSLENQFNYALSLISLHKYGEASHYLERVIEKFPTNELALLSLADTYMMLRRWEEATLTFEKAIENYPIKRYKKYYEISQDVILRERFVISREKCDESQVYIEKKDYKAAYELLKEAFELDENNAKIVNNLGTVALLAGKPVEECYKYFEKAVVLDPKNEKYKESLKFIKRKIKK